MIKEQYQDLKAGLELLEILAESEQDVAAGRIAPMADTFTTLRNELSGTASYK